MDTVYDLSRITRTLKSNENVIAFTGFSIDSVERNAKEGVLKISSFLRPDRSGYLTLTFILDMGNDTSFQEFLASQFSDISENTLRPFFREEFETVFHCPIDTISDSPAWYFEEINIYFKTLQGRERRLIEQQLIPALEHTLHFRFDPLEWWDQLPPKSAAGPVSTGKNAVAPGSLKSAMLKWFNLLKQ